MEQSGIGKVSLSFLKPEFFAHLQYNQYIYPHFLYETQHTCWIVLECLHGSIRERKRSREEDKTVKEERHNYRFHFAVWCSSAQDQILEVDDFVNPFKK